MYALPNPNTEAAAAPPEVGESQLPPEEVAKIKLIRDAIRAEDRRLRTTYPFLAERYQDVMGLAIFLGTCPGGVWSW